MSGSSNNVDDLLNSNAKRQKKVSTHSVHAASTNTIMPAATSQIAGVEITMKSICSSIADAHGC